MSDQFIGEIRAFAFGFVPYGWLPCNGQTEPISQYTPLYAVIQHFYGPSTSSTFTLPNLNGAAGNVGLAMMGTGQGQGAIYPLGQKSGLPTVTLSQSQLPVHTHAVNGLSVPNTDSHSEPTAGVSYIGHLIKSDGSTENAFSDQSLSIPPATLDASALSVSGAASPVSHDNMQPFVSFTYAIAWQGLFPQRS